jgi:ABC-type uncharacterized transport system auxiliary subunit
VNTKGQLRWLAGIPFMAILAISGCGGKVHYPTMYMLNLPAPAARTPGPAEPVLGPLVVDEFRCPEYLCEGRIVYRPSPEEVGFYEYHRWAMNPHESITQYVADTARAKSVFKAVSINRRDVKAAYILSGSIEHFEEMDQGHDVRALCTISAQLLDATTGSVVWTQTASETVPVERRDASGVVNSLSGAARATIDRLLQSMVSQLGRAHSNVSSD